MLVHCWPRAGSGVEGIDSLRFQAGCRKRRLNQALSVLCLSIGFLIVFSVDYYGATFLSYANLHICICSVSWLFWLSCPYLPSGFFRKTPFSLSLSVLTAIFTGEPKLKMAEVEVTTGVVSCAKLHSNHHHQQTNTQLFTGRIPFLSPNQQCQSTEGKYHIPWTCLPQAHLGSYNFGPNH